MKVLTGIMTLVGFTALMIGYAVGRLLDRAGRGLFGKR